MRFPDDDGLPLWLFILIILFTTAIIALIAFVVWRRCTKRPRRPKHLSSGASESAVRKTSFRKGQIVGSLLNLSLTGPRFGSGASREKSRHPSNQWPGTAYFDENQENVEKLGYQYSACDVSSFGDSSIRVPQRTWSDVLRRQSSAGLKRPDACLLDEENVRASYVSHCGDCIESLNRTHSRRQMSTIKPPSLDSPAPLPPLTPLTLPRTPQHPVLNRTTFRLLSKYAAIPPLPAVSRHREESTSRRNSKQRDSRSLDWPSSPPYCGVPQGQECPSSALTRESFLQTWSSAYHGWLAKPETPSSNSAPANPDLREASHADVMSINGSASEKSEDSGIDISLPSSTPILSPSPVSRPHSLGISPSPSDRKHRGKIARTKPRTGQDRISWLVDS
jgi:hypothetical protein